MLVKIIGRVFALLLCAAMAGNDVMAKERDAFPPKATEVYAVTGDRGCVLEVAMKLSSQLPYPQQMYFLATEAVACDMFRLARDLIQRALFFEPNNTTYLDFLAYVEETLKDPQ